MRALVCLFLSLFVVAAHAQDATLEATDSAHIRERIEVTWSLPEGASGLLEIRPKEEGARRASYAYLNSNPAGITAPEAPGSYELVLVVDRVVSARLPLEVFMPEASVAAPASAGVGELIDVQWTGPVNGNDRLTFITRDGEPVRASGYAYVGNLRGGPARIKAPVDPGDYDVVYLTGSTILARAPISVRAVAAEVSVPAEIHAGGRVPVTWQGPENAQDLLTFATRDGERIAGASYTYVGNARNDGRATLRASETPGTYDVVYVSSGRIIGRAPINVTQAEITMMAPDVVQAPAEFVVEWEGAGNTGDVIRLYRSDDETLVQYHYVDPNSRQVRFQAPSQPGSHQLRYQTRGGREMDRRDIAVQPPPVEPGQLLVLQTRAALGPRDAVEVILDASGSMLQRLDGERRIAIARETLKALVGETIPAGTGFALRVFGHREADSCRTDLEISLGPLEPAAALAAIDAIEARNLARTPIGRSVALAADDLEGVPGKRVLILLTDGEETCDGDAAAAIQSLRDLGWDIQVNIVGFAIDDDALEDSFRAWAAAGGGRYFAASGSGDLREALTRATTGPFEVTNPESGEVVARGVPGESLTLPAGSYRVRGAAAEIDALIEPGQQTRISIDGE